MNRKFELEKLLATDPDNSFVRYALAKEYESEGNLTEAINWLEKLRSSNPNYTGLYYHLASLYKNINKLEESKSIAQFGIEICTKLKHQHELSELRTFLMNMQIDDL